MLANFPDPEASDHPFGLIAYGGELNSELLIEAYRKGIFPWPEDADLPMLWFSPPSRGILEFKNLHISKSLKKSLKRNDWTHTIDQAFGEVIKNCASAPRPGQKGTWIIPDLERAYIEFHKAGHAHSFEVWEGQELIGGLYGVDVDGLFVAESMFFKKPNASKVCLVKVVEHLKEKGLHWMDIQMVTPHMENMGATEISRSSFLEKLAQARALSVQIF